MVAGLLLTGGTSRRLGFDKAELLLEGERLADRAAGMLQAVCDPVLEVGPGLSSLPSVRETNPQGPLTALVAGAAELRAQGDDGPVLLLAVDLPFVDSALLGWLAARPGGRTVVPFDGDGEPQPCCARYAPDALDAAARLVSEGRRSLRALLDAVPIDRIPHDEWRAIAAPHALDDVDTPEDVARHGLTMQG